MGRRRIGQPVVNSVARSNKGEEGARDLRGLHNAFTLTVVFASSVFVLSMFDPGVVVRSC